MATTFALTIPDAQAARVIDAIAGRNGWPDQAQHDATTGALTETKAQFAKRMLIQWVHDQVRTHERNTYTQAYTDQAPPAIT